MRRAVLISPAVIVRLLVLVMGAGLAAASLSAQLKTPPDWKWRLDSPGVVVEASEPKAGEVTFVAMPPGWHVTSGPGSLLYHPDYLGKGNFAVEAEVFLFPGESQSEYGIFVGGKNLGPNETPSYLAFVARRDGQGAILRRQGPPIVDWTTNDAILPNVGGKDAVKNILRAEATAREVIFSANGKEIARAPRANLSLEGQMGFRVGQGMNLHASRLDVTYRLAPMPVK